MIVKVIRDYRTIIKLRTKSRMVFMEVRLIQKTISAGQLTNKEICTADKIIGFDVQAAKETNMFKIHHSKNRTHIVPYSTKEE